MTDTRIDWFTRARYGMFIHWGLYSVHGRGEWAMQREQTPVAEYEALAKRFDAAAFRPATLGEARP